MVGMEKIRPVVEKKGRKGKVRLVKGVYDLDLVLRSRISVQLQHKYNGEMYVFNSSVEEKVDDTFKREFMEVYEDRILTEGIKSDDIPSRFVDVLREVWKEAFDLKMQEIEKAVDMCFSLDKPMMLEIGDTKIRLKNYCTFDVLSKIAFVEVLKEEDQIWAF